MLKLIFLTNLLATLFMTGVIWIVQVVHYPLFARVGELTWRAYHAEHNVLITWIVLPAMVLEAGTAALLVVNRPDFVSRPAAWVGLALVVLAWGTTFFLSVPQHDALAAGFDPAAHRLLVSTNWLRTFAWSGRTGLILWQLWKGLAS